MPEAISRGGEQSSPRLSGPARELIRRINEKGPVTFAEFMDVALYWPDGGYYTSGRGAWGKGGDYITSLDVSPVFSQMLAVQVIEAWTLMGQPEGFTLIEAGAGRGWLTKGILDSIKSRAPVLYNTIRARLIEKNPHLREPSEDRITWHSALNEIEGPVTGVVITNELIDSLPVHRVVQNDGLKELYAGYDSGFHDVEGELSTPELGRYFSEAGIELAQGMVTEVNLEAKRWLTEASRVLGKGFVITIDYGLPARELYSPERKRGSLHCHYRHKLNDNPYINIGEQDITAHVDFSAFAKAGRGLGLELTGFTTQKNFLLGLGILSELSQADDMDLENIDKIKFNRALGALIMPGGMGDTFKVMIQHRGVDSPVLSGFSFKEMSKYL